MCGLYCMCCCCVSENIADNGGIKQSFVAFEQYQTDKGKDEQIDPTITNEQLFFLAYGQRLEQLDAMDAQQIRRCSVVWTYN